MALHGGGDVPARLAALREKFLVRVEEDMTLLRHYSEQARQGTLRADGLVDCYQRLHRLAGSAGTFGLPELGVEARALEKGVKRQAEVFAETGTEADGPIDVGAGFADGIDALAQHLQALPERSGDSNAGGPAQSMVADGRGMQVHVILVEPRDGGLGGLADDLTRYGFQCRLHDQPRMVSLPETIDGVAGAAAILCRDESLMEVLAARDRHATDECRQPVPVICVGADASFGNRYRVARLGAAAFFPEPIDIPELADRIEAVATERRGGVQGRVVIVEDDAELAEHYALVLQSRGIEARIVQHPLDLMATLSAFQPDIVLMDVQMGDYSGVTLARMIRFEPRWLSLPIIYLSSEDDPDNQLDALAKGADEFLMKPVSDDYLVRSVRVRCQRARQLSELMNRDSLTGLLKHSLIKQEVDKELARCRREGHPSSVVMVDLDHFKRVNDTWGHRQGDLVIRTLANLLRNRLRETDVIGRYGGEEFLLVLPNCDVQAAADLIRQVGESFAELVFLVGDSRFQVTLSAGVAAINDVASGDEALEAADQALYERKRAGRKGVTVYEPLRSTDDGREAPG